MRLNNRYENAFLDERKTTIINSRLSNGEVGIETDQGSYQTTPALSRRQRRHHHRREPRTPS